MSSIEVITPNLKEMQHQETGVDGKSFHIFTGVIGFDFGHSGPDEWHYADVAVEIDGSSMGAGVQIRAYSTCALACVLGGGGKAVDSSRVEVVGTDNRLKLVARVAVTSGSRIRRLAVHVYAEVQH